MTAPLLSTRFLFRFSAPCRHREKLWTEKGAKLDEKHRLIGLIELEERIAWAEVRAAWNETGLVFSVQISGKTQPAWCRAARPEDSDGFRVWIDTRDVHNVHRATRFCHQFVFTPGGAGPQLDQPMMDMLPINRAKEQAPPAPRGMLRACCTVKKDGYILDALIPAEALTGFDPAEYPRLGFTYAVIDRELGEQTFGVGSPMPYQEDPSLWATLELKK